MSKENINPANKSTGLNVMQIIAMSFAILAVVVFVTVSLTRWIIELNERAKFAKSKAARIERLKKSRIKHILKQRKLQKREQRLAEKECCREDGDDCGCEDFDCGFMEPDKEAGSEEIDLLLAEEEGADSPLINNFKLD